MKKFVSLSTGVRIEYVEQGKADGVPVIFLHGVTDSWRSFERVLPLLPPNIHAFALSQRGHGDSSRPTSGYRFADMSADLLAFLEAMGLRTAIIVGHSMGASVAQRFVIDHPDRVARLVLMGAFSTYDDPGLADFVASSIAPLTDPIAPPFAREWQVSTLARAMPADHLDAVVAETLKVPARVWREAFDGFLKTPDFTSELTRVSMPVLLMWGDRDSYALRAAQDRLLEVMPNARLIAYQGFGHAFHWEDPKQFTKDLVPFLTSWTGRDSRTWRRAGPSSARSITRAGSATQIVRNPGMRFPTRKGRGMARLVFGMNQSLDGYVDHMAFAPSPTLFRHFIEEAQGQAGSVYGRQMYEVMRYWDDDHPEWDAAEHAFAAAWRKQPKWVVSRSLKSVGPNARLVEDDLEGAIRELKAERDGEIEVAGPDLAQSLTELGLIDEYRIYLHPVVLGHGKPYFAGPRPPLRLMANDRIEDVIRLAYVPA